MQLLVVGTQLLGEKQIWVLMLLLQAVGILHLVAIGMPHQVELLPAAWKMILQTGLELHPLVKSVDGMLPHPKLQIREGEATGMSLLVGTRLLAQPPPHRA